jgi:hypothetical protein
MGLIRSRKHLLGHVLALRLQIVERGGHQEANEPTIAILAPVSLKPVLVRGSVCSSLSASQKISYFQSVLPLMD